MPQSSQFTQDGSNATKQQIVGSVHNIFKKARFEHISQEDHELLLPSFRLASMLLTVGLPYIASFLPHERVLNALKDSREGKRVVPLKTLVSREDLDAAAAELERVAECVTWDLRPDLWTEVANGLTEPREWLGVTRLIKTENPWAEPYSQAVERMDARKLSSGENRSLHVGVMGDFLKAMQESRQSSDRHLRAAFMFAIVLVHEIGHCIYHYDTSSFFYGTNEPYVGDSCIAELGTAFVSWIFGGFHPHAQRNKGEITTSFDNLLYWEPTFYTKQGKLTLYKTLYSIPIEFIEKTLAERFWNGLSPK